MASREGRVGGPSSRIAQRQARACVTAREGIMEARRCPVGERPPRRRRPYCTKENPWSRSIVNTAR